MLPVDPGFRPCEPEYLTMWDRGLFRWSGIGARPDPAPFP
jgi:hypothetical protein